MITELSLKDIDLRELSDLNGIEIDCDLPISERIKNFVMQTRFAQLFNVNGKAVKVVFDSYAEICFQDALTNAFKNIIRSSS